MVIPLIYRQKWPYSLWLRKAREWFYKVRSSKSEDRTYLRRFQHWCLGTLKTRPFGSSIGRRVRYCDILGLELAGNKQRMGRIADSLTAAVNAERVGHIELKEMGLGAFTSIVCTAFFGEGAGVPIGDTDTT